MGLENIGRLTEFYDTKANVEALSGALDEIRFAYATDTNELGAYVGGGWVWFGSGGGSGLPWFNVKDYGAVGDGSTDDTAAVAATIAAMTDGGVLYFPHPSDFYKTSGGFSLTQPTTVQGDGYVRTGSTFIPALSQVVCTSTSASLFTVNSQGCSFYGLDLENTAAGAKTAGAGVTVAVGANAEIASYRNCFFNGFYIDLDIQDGYGWVVENCHFGNPVFAAIKVAHTDLPDGADSVIANCEMSGSASLPFGIYYQSGGGLKIANNKINGGFSYGIKGYFDGIETSVLLIVGNSIENCDTDNINIEVTATASSRMAAIVIANNEIGGYGSSGFGINCTAATLGTLYDIAISSNVFIDSDPSSNTAISLTKCDNVNIVGNVIDGYTGLLTQSGCTNVVTGGGSSSPLTTKGDVYTYSSADARLPVGANGQVLAADSTQTTGLKWVTPATTGLQVLMSGDSPPDPLTNDDDTDWLYG